MATKLICNAQTGNGDSLVIDRALPGSGGGAGAVVITSTVGSTPTVTVNIQGSVDGTNYFNVPYYAGAWAVAPTYILTAITITTATTVMYNIRAGEPWQFLKLVLSANTNVTLTATAVV